MCFETLPSHLTFYRYNKIETYSNLIFQLSHAGNFSLPGHHHKPDDVFGNKRESKNNVEDKNIYR